MTRTTNARVAGTTYFVYLVAGISSLVMAGRPHVTGVLSVFESFSALVLGVTLYAITRDEDRDIAMLGLMCRVIESIPGEGYIYFAVSNVLFSSLLLRGRMIPAALAWLGVVGSVLLVVVLLVQRAGLLGGPTGWSSSITWIVSLPVLVFELWFAVWLLTKGVSPRTTLAPLAP